ncbi:hypothetical protein QN277_012432 [Acacia crassicarpa]|uniref:Uncharacterized protein n=1 Tax=Acacia crassicarpa TaxID=499986 RepID=A0AAE1N185_9FABA|nr:hypothetical protein QN277_012432 [Acacia crassicarpa]
MDIRNWCRSSSDNSRGIVQLGTSRSGKMKWRMLWMKFKKEKKRLLHQSSTTSSLHNIPYYDPHTYSQNFDQGIALDDPDNLSRSFSARFADPSRLHLNKVVV